MRLEARQKQQKAFVWLHKSNAKKRKNQQKPFVGLFKHDLKAKQPTKFVC